MNITVKFDARGFAVHIPDGYVHDLGALQNDFLEWIENQPVYSALPGQKTGMCYDINHFLQYLNAVLLADSSERAYCLTHGKTGKMPVIAF